MIEFFCTRCGAALGVPEELADRNVQCEVCNKVLRAPQSTVELPDEPPFAEPVSPLDELAAQVWASEVRELTGVTMPLDYRDRRLPAIVQRSPGMPAVREPAEAIAKRLERVEATTDTKDHSMTTCPHCGSTIAPYVGRCPFCRHPLHGS